MAGFATDTTTSRFTVAWTDPDGRPRTVTLIAYDDGVNGPEWSATVDDRPAEVTEDVEVLIDGITPLDEETP